DPLLGRRALLVSLLVGLGPAGLAAALFRRSRLRDPGNRGLRGTTGGRATGRVLDLTGARVDTPSIVDHRSVVLLLGFRHVRPATSTCLERSRYFFSSSSTISASTTSSSAEAESPLAPV